MNIAMKNEGKKTRYKVYFIREGEPKVRHLDYVWATSADEAERIIRDRRIKVGEKILKIKAGALG